MGKVLGDMARDRRMKSIRPALRLLGLGLVIGSLVYTPSDTRAEERTTLDKPITATWQEIAGAIGATQSAKLQNAYPLRNGAAAGVNHAEELHCLALNIYFEARSEPHDGQRAVAHVVLNRVENPKFPSTICQVVRQGGEQVRHRCQFSWWCDGRSDRPAKGKVWDSAQALARAIYWGYSQDPTDGAMWYHADYVAPSWGAHFERGPKIGRHIFYRANEERS